MKPDAKKTAGIVALGTGIVRRPWQSLLLVLTVALIVAHLLHGQASQPAVGPAAPQEGAQSGQPAPVHPLDDLTADEIALTVKVLGQSGKLPARAFFPLVALAEPDKKDVLAHKPGKVPARSAFAVVLDRPSNRTYEAIVDLQTKKVHSWEEKKGVQPLVLPDECDQAGKIVRADPKKRWHQAMRKRGLKATELDDIHLDTWAPGYVDRPDLKGARLLRVLSYVRGKNNNPYPRIIEGVVALVNMTRGEVVEVTDEPIVPIPPTALDFFDPTAIGGLRPALPPLEIRLPQGASFELSGQEVRWQNWSFRYSFHPRVGLQLYLVRYRDQGKERPILYQASLSEMVVPYADPAKTWSWRNAFDVGEYGLGTTLVKLHKGQEVPAHAALLPVVLANEQGVPKVKEGAVAIYEQDGGMLWTHADYNYPEKPETRRARQLVVEALYVVGNYDYGLRWIFGQEGSLELQVGLSGVLLSKGTPEQTCQVCEQKPDPDGKVRGTGDERYGVRIDRRIVAPHHQHFFCFRLHFEVDGGKNSLCEMNLVPEARVPANPDQNAFLMEQHLLRSEREACRELNHDTHRSWKVFNPNQKTSLGHFPAYRLEPGVNARPFAHPESSVRQRAGFLSHQLWATPYRRGELYAAGDYPNQARGGEGLPRWIQANQDLVNQDLVLWYTMGVTHVPRAEEWPVMPMTRAGFRLVPDNFFERNPALDVPRGR